MHTNRAGLLALLGVAAILAVPQAGAAGPAGWGTASSLEANPDGWAQSPSIAFDEAGNGLAVWYQSDGLRNNIWAARFTPGALWGAPALIETDDAGDAVLPQVAVGGGGDAFAVWRQSDGTRTNIWAAHYTPGPGWQSAVLLERDDVGWAQNARVSADPWGNATAVWSQDDGNFSSLYSARFSAGAGWSAPVLVENATGDVQEPHVATDGTGASFAVWSQFDGTRYNIWTARHAPGAGWSAPSVLEREDSGWALTPKVAASQGGDAVAVWHQSDGARNNIWAARYQRGLGWGVPAQVEHNDAGDALEPEVATDASGNAVAVWHQYDGTRFDIFANRYVAGAGWGTPAPLEASIAGDSVLPDVAVDAAGNAVAVWYQHDGTRYNIWASRFVPGAGWGNATALETDDAGNAFTPRVAVDGGGNATAVWHQWNGARFQVFANRFSVPTAPSAPLGVSAAPGTGRVELRWSAPTDDGGANLTGYNLYRGAAQGALGLLGFVGPVLNFTDTEVRNGITYFYELAALNGFREGARSAPVNATPVGPPGPPGSVSAVPGDGRVTVSWGSPLDVGGLAVSGFRIYRSEEASPPVLVASPAAEGTYEDLGVTNGFAYNYSVSAVNPAGEGAQSAASLARPVGPPPAPRALAATPGPARAFLTWQPPVIDGGSPITGYNLYRAAPGDTFALRVSLGDVLLFDDAGLTNGLAYQYLVRAANEHGVGALSAPATVTPVGPPGAPSIEEIAAGRGEVRLRWAPPSDSGGLAITGYAVYRRTAGGNATLLATLPGQLEFTDTGLAFDQAYYYQVSAINSIGEGLRSAVSGATLGAPPDTAKPTVAILEPAAGARLSGPRVRFAGTASDNVAVLKVEVSTDGVSWTAVAAVPRGPPGNVDWTADLQVSAGSQTLFVRATDASGNDATASVGLEVAAGAPPTAAGESAGGSVGVLAAALAGVGGSAGAWALLVLPRRRKAREGGAEPPMGVPPAPSAGAAALPAAAPEGALSAALLPAGQPRRTYLVEDLFLLYHDGRVIFSRGGLGADAVEDPDSVGIMLVAVQEFIRDSFKKGEAVDKMSYGDNAILLRKGAHTIVGVTVFGDPDPAFVDQLQEMVAKVEGTYAGIIEEWDGNKTRFKGVEAILAPLWRPTSDLTRADVLLATNQPIVQMISGVEFFQGFVRLKVAVVNNTPSVITGVTVDLDLNKEVLRLHRIEPSGYRAEGTKVSLGVLNTGEKATIAYNFDPQMCTVSLIDGTCRYKDYEGSLHTVTMKSRKAEVVCPLFFTKEQANTAMLKRLVETELKQFDVKAFEFAAPDDDEALRDLFEAMRSVVQGHDVKLVRSFESQGPYAGEAWFYGRTQPKGYQVVIRCAVSAADGRAEFYVAAISMRAVTGLLAELAHAFDAAARERFASLRVAALFDEEVRRPYADAKRVGKMIEGVVPS